MSNPNEIMPPGVQQLLEDQRAEIFASLNCVNIGKIESVKPSEQTVAVQLQIRRPAVDGTSTLYPVLVDCPYFVLQGGGAYIDMPIKAGDYCLVLFNDRCIDTWWYSANVADPPLTRKHSLSDGIALIGLNPKPNALDMDGGSAGIIAGANKVRILNDAESLYTLMGDLIDAISNLTTYGSPASHTVTAASQASLSALKTRYQSLLKE